jgi:predicted SAM-dependent methyltransferase
MPGCYVYDMRNLPMKGIDDNTYNGAYNEHFIEHLESVKKVLTFFREMYRVIKPGGVIRTVWPPMDFVEWLRSPQDLSNHPFVQHYYCFMLYDISFRHQVMNINRNKNNVLLVVTPKW